MPSRDECCELLRWLLELWDSEDKNVSYLGSPRKSEMFDTWINYLPQKLRAGLSSSHSLSRGENLLIPAAISFLLHVSDCASTLKASRLARQNPVLWGDPSEKLGARCTNQCLSTPGKTWELVGLFLTIWFPAKGKDSRGCPKSHHWLQWVISCSSGSRKLLINFWTSQENLSMNFCWIFLFVGRKRKSPGFPPLYLANVNFISFFYYHTFEILVICLFWRKVICI